MATIGQRFVQMTVSHACADGHLPGPGQWERFRPIAIDGYTPQGGNVYFFSVSMNPVSLDSLIALVPVAQNRAACVAASFSRDGLRWSPLQPLTVCTTDLESEHARSELERLKSFATYRGHRSTSQPAANVLLWKDRVLIFIHEQVPGIGERGQARLVRYSMPIAKFAAWTNASLASM